MSFWDAWFGTPTEKKREQYRTLYNDLNSQLKTFKAKLKTMEGKVDTVRTNQSSDAKNLSSAVDAAYERYKYYDRLAEQERKEREAEARRQAEERINRNKSWR